MNTKEIIWASGFFEGEGCFAMGKGRVIQPIAKVVSTDRDSLERFQKAVGMGKVTDLGFVDKSTKPVFHWRISNHEQVQALASMLWYGLGKRRRAKVKEIFTAYNNESLVVKRKSKLSV